MGARRSIPWSASTSTARAQKFWFRGTISMRRRASAPTAPACRGSPGAIRTCRGSRQRPGSARSFGRNNRQCAPGRRRRGRIGVPAGMVARRRPQFRFRPGLGLVEPLCRARRRGRTAVRNGRRIRPPAMAVRDVDLRLRIRRAPDRQLRPRRRLAARRDRRGPGGLDLIATEFTDIAQVRAAGGRVAFIGGSPSRLPRSSTST